MRDNGALRDRKLQRCWFIRRDNRCGWVRKERVKHSSFQIHKFALSGFNAYSRNISFQSHKALRKAVFFLHQLFDAEQRKESGRVFSWIPTQHLLLKVEPKVSQSAASTNNKLIKENKKSPAVWMHYLRREPFVQRENKVNKTVDRQRYA